MHDWIPHCTLLYPAITNRKFCLLPRHCFLEEIKHLINAGKISDSSRVLFVNDGSRDNTWEIFCNLVQESPVFCGISQSRNRGHQNAVLAGLMEAKDLCDITITIDCDGQDDITAMESMVDAYSAGNDVVYGVRAERLAGESHYPLRKTLALSIDGITSLSIKPIRLISTMGFLVSFLSGVGVIWAWCSFCWATPYRAGLLQCTLSVLCPVFNC